jgi:hypothetical protein
MCKFKSGLILKNKVVLAPENNESHSALLESLGIEDNYINATKKFVRAELVPKDNNKATDISEWEFIVDQDETPDWFDEDRDRYEEEFRDAVRDYMKDRLTVICGYCWTPIKREDNKTWYLMDDFLEKSSFGRNNNYAESYIRKKLNDGELAQKLKAEFGDKLVPITTDLLSLDGLDDYGIVDGDIIAIPTLDLYRECRKRIPKLDRWWWLATPHSTPSGYGSSRVRYVGNGGSVDCFWCDDGRGAVRPCFILED